MPNPQTKRARRWCFTINNPSTLDAYGARLLVRASKYGIVSHETGAEGTKHLQGYVNLPNAKTFATIKKWLPRSHLEQAKGNDKQNQQYCSKEQEDIYEYGEPDDEKTQGGMEEFFNFCKLRKSVNEIATEYPSFYIRYPKAIDRIHSLEHKERTNQPHVEWLFGEAGVGKTRYVFDKHGYDNVYVKDNTPWWDGYSQHEVILIDDFDNQIPYRTLLRILDRYPYNGQVKGSYIAINSPFIYITSEYSPDEYWSDNQLKQVTRRLCVTKELL